MPRRIHVESDDVLGAASTAMEITESITDLVHVPIASTVAPLVSVVLKAVKVGLRCHLIMNNKSNHSLRMSRIITTLDSDSHTPWLLISKHYAHILTPRKGKS